MDITSLKKNVEDSGISPESKNEILEMIDTEGVYSEGLVLKIQKMLDGTVENLIEQVANLEIQDAAEEFEKEMDGLDQELDELNQEINKNVTEIDLADIHSELGIK